MPDKFLNISLSTISPAQMRAAVSDTLVNGATTSQWWRRQRDSFVRGVMDDVREGVRNGQSNAEMARTLRSRSFARHRSHANALAATATSAISNRARTDTFLENDDVIKGVQQVSTLDNKTSDVCIAYSGMAWSLPDYEPMTSETTLPFNGGPPRHFNCRSTLVPVLKSFEELGLPPTQFPEGTRASLDGQVPGNITFDAFLKGKTKTFQDQLLGPARAKLWRAGKITLNQLVDMRGNPLTIDELLALSKKRKRKPPPAPAPAPVAQPATVEEFEGVPKFKNGTEAENWVRQNAVNREGKYATATLQSTGATNDVSTNFVKGWNADGLRIAAMVTRMINRRFGIEMPNYFGRRDKHPQYKFRGSRNALASVHMESDSLLVGKSGVDLKLADEQIPLIKRAVAQKVDNRRAQADAIFRQNVEVSDNPALIKAWQSQRLDDDYVFTVGDNGTGTGAQAIWRTYVHESGHRIHAHFRAELDGILAQMKDKALWKRSTSEYARTNDKELVAEQFVLYMLGKKDRVQPELFKFFEKLDKGGDFGPPPELGT